jgi:hypothetical protein
MRMRMMMNKNKRQSRSSMDGRGFDEDEDWVRRVAWQIVWYSCRFEVGRAKNTALLPGECGEMRTRHQIWLWLRLHRDDRLIHDCR